VAKVRVLLVDANRTVDVFDVVDVTEEVARVRTPYLFEIGEELVLRFERDDKTQDRRALVRKHVGDDDDKITELELEPR
jgi:hypothetical protein